MACFSLVKLENFWKLDKIDKIFISFLFIFVTMFCIFNTFTYAYTPTQNMGLQYDSVSNIITNNPQMKYFYYELRKDVEYTLLNNTNGSLGLAYIPGVPEIGMKGEYIKTVGPGEEYSFTPTENTYLYLFGWSYSISNFDGIVINSSLSFKGVISDLVNYVGINDIFNIFQNIIPFVCIVVLFSLGVWFIKHNIIEHSKGRDF